MRDGGDNLKDVGPRLFGEEDWRIETDHIQKDRWTVRFFWKNEAFKTTVLRVSLLPMCVWQGVAMESLKSHPGPPCPILLCPAGGHP
jgi:hypothetical protein